MYYLVYRKDASGAKELRVKFMEPHLEYIKEYKKRFLIGGPFFDPAADDNSDNNASGGCFIIKADSYAEVRGIVDNDPFTKEGVFGTIIIERWKPVIRNLDN